MAVVMTMTATSRADYERVVELLGLDADPPKGLIAHAACEVDGLVEVTDIWETAEDLDTFFGTRLGKVLAEVGVEPTKQPSVVPAFNLFTA